MASNFGPSAAGGARLGVVDDDGVYDRDTRPLDRESAEVRERLAQERDAARSRPARDD